MIVVVASGLVLVFSFEASSFHIVLDLLGSIVTFDTIMTNDSQFSAKRKLLWNSSKLPGNSRVQVGLSLTRTSLIPNDGLCSSDRDYDQLACINNCIQNIIINETKVSFIL